MKLINIQGIPIYHFQQHLKNIKFKIKKWNKEVFGDIFKSKRDLKVQMDLTQQAMIYEGPIEHLISEETFLQTQIDNRAKTRRDPMEIKIQSSMA
jgi:hypothetical protein